MCAASGAREARAHRLPRCQINVTTLPRKHKGPIQGSRQSGNPINVKVACLATRVIANVHVSLRCAVQASADSENECGLPLGDIRGWKQEA